jgi:hypothetical protein
MSKIQFDSDSLIDSIKESKWLRYGFYAAGSILAIWLLGKSSKVLTGAILNFKSLRDAIKR